MNDSNTSLPPTEVVKAEPRDIDAAPRMLPGESFSKYQKRWGREAKKKVAILSTAFAEGKMRTGRQIKNMARRLGCSERQILQWKMNKAMTAKVAEKLQRRAVYAAAEALNSQAEKAHEDISSFRTICQLAKVLDTGSVNVQTNIGVDARNGGDTQGDARFFEKFRERLNQGTIRKLQAIDVTPEAP